MVFFRGTGDEDVINVGKDVLKATSHIVDEPLECLNGVLETKGHPEEIEEVVKCNHRCRGFPLRRSGFEGTPAQGRSSKRPCSQTVRAPVTVLLRMIFICIMWSNSALALRHLSRASNGSESGRGDRESQCDAGPRAVGGWPD